MDSFVKTLYMDDYWTSYIHHNRIRDFLCVFYSKYSHVKIVIKKKKDSTKALKGYINHSDILSTQLRKKS